MQLLTLPNTAVLKIQHAKRTSITDDFIVVASFFFVLSPKCSCCCVAQEQKGVPTRVGFVRQAGENVSPLYFMRPPVGGDFLFLSFGDPLLGKNQAKCYKAEMFWFWNNVNPILQTYEGTQVMAG